VLLLGLALNALAWWLLDRPSLRWPGVLQRIGLCIALAGVIVTAVGRGRLWAIVAALLVGHAALLVAGGTLEPLLDLSSRVDAWLFGPHGYRWDPQTGLGRDPEGLVSTLGALATTLLGYLLGRALRIGQDRRVLGAGIVLAAMGWGLDAAGVMPINKALWTPSFVLWTGGLAAVALALCHRLVDVRGWPPIGRRFGVNAIAAYAGAWLGSILLAASGLMPRLYDGVFGTLFGRFGPEAQSLSFALATVAVWWVVMVAMDRWKIYLKL
jgi:predicted acyltransferase